MPTILNSLDSSHLLIAVSAVLFVWVAYLEWRLHRFMRGQNGASLEETFVALSEKVAETDKINEEIQEHLIKMEERLQRSIQHVKIVRFNPFPDQGGNQSSATALLDEHGNGAVISTLYSRERTNVFVKPIKRRHSDHELSAEERQAIVR